jgi:hypothetical protein
VQHFNNSLAPVLQDDLLIFREGMTYSAKYSNDVQFVFSRVQHHMHKLDKKSGKRVPLSACRIKGKGDKQKKSCKARFPKEKQVSATVKVVCAGVAAKHDLRISGRRNALGSFLGKRNCVWMSGTAPSLAAGLRSNTNTSPNFRVPIDEHTHERSCPRDCLKKGFTWKQLCIVTQRAAKQLTGYFTGYTCKRQPVGKYELQQSQLGMSFMRE